MIIFCMAGMVYSGGFFDAENANYLMALRDAGTKTKLASSLLIMTIVGGAIAPVKIGRAHV